MFRVFYTPSFNSGWMSFSKRVGKNTPQCYTKPLDSLKNWNNHFFCVDERVFPTVVDWRTNASKDGMPAESTYSIEAVRALDIHRTPIQKQPEMLPCLVGISRRYYLGDEVYGSIQFNSCPKSYEGEDWKPPTRPHEVPLLTLTATRVIEMDNPATAIDSSGVPSTIERSPLDFAHEAGASDQGTAEEAAATDPLAATESRKRGHDGTDVNAPPKSLRRDHADPRPIGSSHEGKSLAAIQLGLTSTVFMPEDAPACVSDPDPLSFADPPSRHPANIAQSFPGTAAAGDPKSENAFSPVEVRSPESIYRSEWGVSNGSLLDTPKACQDLVDHLRLRFEQEAKLLRKSVAQVARRDKRIQARELEIKNLEALLETEADMKKAAKDKSAGLIQELEDMRARFSDPQLSNEHLSQQVATLQEQVSGEEKLKEAFEEFKWYEVDRVEQRCAELDARLDALSIDFDEELYSHMLTANAGRRWVIGHGLRLAVMKCGESLEMSSSGIEGFEVSVSGSVEGPEGCAYRYAIVANVSRAEKKKKCRIVCRTHGVGSAYHPRSDGVPVSMPTVVPQGLALLLADAATQTEFDT
uniref:Transposase (Putative), gypsy type n=1 Tax=Tanacetum cinerariifolium TaxID=118510 RepID=A0A6L2NPM7_TANCI|nr:hypothetical protein [Tanacetum cinerariifolium]